MIIVDANLLIYAVDRESALNVRAKRWWESVLNGQETVVLPWQVLLAFLRLTTRAGILPHPLPVRVALEVLDSWIAQPCVTVLDAPAKHWDILRSLLAEVGTAGNLTSDAHIAALAIGHGARLYSADRDFARFPGLKWSNPLE